MFVHCHQRTTKTRTQKSSMHVSSMSSKIPSRIIQGLDQKQRNKNEKKKKKNRNREDTSLGSPDPGLYWPVVIASPEASELSGAEPVAFLPRSGDVAQIGPPPRASHQIRRHHRGRSSSTPVDLLAGLLAAAGRGGTPCGGGRDGVLLLEVDNGVLHSSSPTPFQRCLPFRTAVCGERAEEGAGGVPVWVSHGRRGTAGEGTCETAHGTSSGQRDKAALVAEEARCCSGTKRRPSNALDGAGPDGRALCTGTETGDQG